MSLFTKLLTRINPVYAAKVAISEYAQQTIASMDRSVDRAETRHRGASRLLRGLRNWQSIPTSGRSDLRQDERKTLIGRSQDAFRNYPIARAAATRIRTNVVGSGLMYRPAVDFERLGISEEQGDKINQEILDEWTRYSANPVECDAEATLDFHGNCSLIEISRFLSGDVFVATPFVKRNGADYELKVQVIDGVRVSNPNGNSEQEYLCDGVEVDALGAPINYYVRQGHPDDHYFNNDIWQQLPVFGAQTGRRRVFHVWNDKNQIGAVRGAPALGPILEPLELLDQFTRAELMAAVISSMFTVFIKKTATDPFTSYNGEVFNDTHAKLKPGEAPRDQPSKFADAVMGLGRGAIVDLAPGEEPEFADPSRPNSGYDPFFNSMVMQMGACLEIPGDEMLLRYQSSYSAARAVMLQAYRYYLLRRDTICTQFCEPFKGLWMDEAVARGRLPSLKGYSDPVRRAAYNQGAWIGPARGAMDESKEAQASQYRIDAGISNRTIETAASSGRDWKEVNRVALSEEKVRVVPPAEKAQTVKNAARNVEPTEEPDAT